MQHKELSKKIPKKKGYNEAVTQLRKKVMRSLKQLSRGPSDRGEQRTMDTPSPEIVLENIKAFMKQWGDTEIDSVILLPSAARKEIDNLKNHVIKAVYLEYHPREELTETKQYIKS